MRCFLSILGVSVLCAVSVFAEGKELSLFEQNKLAIERTAKIYLAFEARHEIGPGASSDLNLLEKAKFYNEAGKAIEWIYPISLGLEIKIGDEQRRIVVLSPQQSGKGYLIATEDLAVKTYSECEIQRILTAINKRKLKLSKSPLD